MPTLSRELREQLITAATAATERAYAPFSQFRVGAAVVTDGGRIFSGCNVENSSYGLTNCAERTAIFRAVAEAGPNLVIKAIAVISAQNLPCSPCGACRQVIYEFGPEATVIFRTTSGWRETPITELLPEGFRLR